jgi:hypothetical protein
VKISINGLDKAEVLAALYNNSRPLGLGILRYDPRPMTIQEARELITDSSQQDNGSFSLPLYFDYIKGRVMKVNLSGNELDTWGYDRDNGEGAAQSAIDRLIK